MNTNNDKIFFIKQYFNSYKDFCDKKKLYEKQNQCILKVTRSKSLQNAYKKRPNVKYNPEIVYDEIYLHCLTEITDQKLSQKVQCPFEVTIRTTGDKQSLNITKMIDKNTKKDYFNHTHSSIIVKENIGTTDTEINMPVNEHSRTITTITHQTDNKNRSDLHSITGEDKVTKEKLIFATQRGKNERFENFHKLMEQLKKDLRETLNVEDQIEKLNNIQDLKDDFEGNIYSANITFTDFQLPPLVVSHPSTSQVSSSTSTNNKIQTESLPQLQLQNIDEISSLNSTNSEIQTEDSPQLQLQNIEEISSLTSTNSEIQTEDSPQLQLQNIEEISSLTSTNSEIQTENSPQLQLQNIEEISSLTSTNSEIQTEDSPQLQLHNIDDPSGSSLTDLEEITITSKSSRGRPKGTLQRAIGLPMKHQSKISRNQTKSFKSFTPKEKTLKILRCLLPEKIVLKVIDTHYKISSKDIKPISISNLADCISSCNIKIVKQYFEQAAFNKLQQLIKEKNKNGPWTCHHCKKTLATESIQCDACLYWFDFHCMDLEKKPKQALWYCKACNDIQKPVL